MEIVMQASLAAVISKVTTMADNTIRLQVDCQEMGPDQTAKVFQHKGRLGWFMFKEQESQPFEEKNLPEVKLESWEKSPSQRMRAVLYRLWEQEYEQRKTGLSFEVYYREKMESIINQIKEKLG